MKKERKELAVIRPNPPSAEELYNAVWQYMVDHALVTPFGKYRIQITIDKKEELLKRIMARHRYGFKKQDAEKLEYLRKHYLKQYSKLVRERKKAPAWKKQAKAMALRSIYPPLRWLTTARDKLQNGVPY